MNKEDDQITHRPIVATWRHPQKLSRISISPCTGPVSSGFIHPPSQATRAICETTRRIVKS
jgi:hypothetical protein